MKNVLRIITEADRLSERCDEVNVFEAREHVTHVINDLKDTLRANQELMALSAPQIGVKERIFCIRFSDGDIKAFINPMITKIQGKFLMIEKDGCDGKEYMMQRPDRVMVGYQTAQGKAETDKTLNNPLSAIFEHMVDVLDGTAHFKHQTIGLPIDSDYYKAPQSQKDELHNWYIDTYLPGKIAELKKVADADGEIKKTQQSIDFMTSVFEGKTEIVPMDDKGDLDFDNSSVKALEKQEKWQKEYEGRLKKKFGIK